VMHSRHPFRLLRRSTSEYDLHLTTNVHNLDDLPRLGARRVALSALRYDSRIFYPRQFTDDALAAFRSEVTFIGHWEERTEQTILDVIAAGVPIKVWGDNWSRARGKRALRNHVMGYSIWGDDYVRALHATKIALCLLSKWNRNTTACRSFEIPATGTFLLAERTDDHVQSYREGVEAEFFADSAELIEKIKHYLAHDRERASIAERGRQRCVASGYSYEAQAGRDWSHVQMLLDGSRAERSA
jgi:spore maturation protein CgeB